MAGNPQTYVHEINGMPVAASEVVPGSPIVKDVERQGDDGTVSVVSNNVATLVDMSQSEVNDVIAWVCGAQSGNNG